MYRAGLWPKIAGLLDEPHVGTDAQCLERTAQDAVAMKVDQATVIGLDAPESLLPVYFADAPACLPGMCLDIPASFPFIVLKLASRRLEGIAQRNIGIIVRLIARAGAPGDDLMTRHGNTHMRGEDIALMMVPVGRFNRDVAVNDLRAEFLQLCCQGACPRLKHGRSVHVAKYDFKGDLHATLLLHAGSQVNAQKYVRPCPDEAQA